MNKGEQRKGTKKTLMRGKKVVGDEELTDTIGQADIFDVDIDGVDHPASVGCSLSMGASTDYGKQKLEAAVWVTLPCRPTPEGIEAATKAAEDICMAEVQRLFQLAEDEFFPGVGGFSLDIEG